eukprot:gene5778-4129_t
MSIIPPSLEYQQERKANEILTYSAATSHTLDIKRHNNNNNNNNNNKESKRMRMK